MLDENIKNLSKYRTQTAEDCFRASEAALDIELKMSINRSYYSILHSMRAVLALVGFDSKKHQGVISEFRKRYIKTAKFSAHFSDVIGTAFEIRNKCDYDDFYVAAKTDAIQQLENAKEFHAAVTEFINNFIAEAEGENGTSD